MIFLLASYVLRILLVRVDLAICCGYHLMEGGCAEWMEGELAYVLTLWSVLSLTSDLEYDDIWMG